MAPLLEFLLALFLFFAYASKLNEKFKGLYWPLTVSEIWTITTDLIVQYKKKDYTEFRLAASSFTPDEKFVHFTFHSKGPKALFKLCSTTYYSFQGIDT